MEKGKTPICPDCLTPNPEIEIEDIGVGPTWMGSVLHVHKQIDRRTRCCDSDRILLADTDIMPIELIQKRLQQPGGLIESEIIEVVDLNSRRAEDIYHEEE